MTQAVPAKFLAELLNISQRRIQQLAKEGTIPKAERGQYPLLACIKGYVSFLQESLKSKKNNNEELMEHRKRFEAARADEMELNLAVRKKELVIASDVEDAMTTMIANFRARLIALPSSVSAQGTGLERAELEELVQKLTHEALDELSGYNPKPG